MAAIIAALADENIQNEQEQSLEQASRYNPTWLKADG
jgi:hypothetical protein